ncbi:MAG: hypothetical protein Q4P13_05585, partial [Psychrobacter sp.]|nr:hypothetical protein [Psychrobacter sp.]
MEAVQIVVVGLLGIILLIVTYRGFRVTRLKVERVKIHVNEADEKAEWRIDATLQSLLLGVVPLRSQIINDITKLELISSQFGSKRRSVQVISSTAAKTLPNYLLPATQKSVYEVNQKINKVRQSGQAFNLYGANIKSWLISIVLFALLIVLFNSSLLTSMIDTSQDLISNPEGEGSRAFKPRKHLVIDDKFEPEAQKHYIEGSDLNLPDEYPVEASELNFCIINSIQYDYDKNEIQLFAELTQSFKRAGKQLHKTMTDKGWRVTYQHEQPDALMLEYAKSGQQYSHQINYVFTQ